MRSWREILAVCIAGWIAAASLPVAVGEPFAPEKGQWHGASEYMASASRPFAGLSVLSRNTKLDSRELRLVLPLVGAGGLSGACLPAGCGRPAVAGRAEGAAWADATLLSLHCLLTV